MCEFALNSTISSATGYSPFQLNYGHDPALPIDVALANLRDCKVESTVEYIYRMKLALGAARDNMEKA